MDKVWAFKVKTSLTSEGLKWYHVAVDGEPEARQKVLEHNDGLNPVVLEGKQVDNTQRIPDGTLLQVLSNKWETATEARKGAWKRKDRVVLGVATAQRAKKLGVIGEHLALIELAMHGFTNIKHLNHPLKNYRFADIYAERDGERFWISVKTRNKYKIDRTRNESYKIDPNQRSLAKQQEDADPGSVAACIGISVVVSENSCVEGEPPNSYSCYFSTLSRLPRKHGMSMLKKDQKLYDCLAYNKLVPAEFDASDCENVFRRRDDIVPTAGSVIAPKAFTHSGHNLEVRANSLLEGWEVRVFEGQKWATAVTYSIKYEIETDAQAQGTGWVSVHALMKLAQDDVQSGQVALLL